MEINYKYTCDFGSPEKNLLMIATINLLEGRYCLNTCKQIVIFVANQTA